MSQNSWVCGSATQPAPRMLPRGPPAPIPRHAPGRLAPDDGRPPLGFGGWGGEVGCGGGAAAGWGSARSTWPRRTGPSPASVPSRRCTAAPVLPIHAPCAPPNAWCWRPRRPAGSSSRGTEQGLFHPSGGAVGGLGGGAVQSEGLWSSWPTGPQNMPGHPGHTPPPLGASRELRGARRELASALTNFCNG